MDYIPEEKKVALTGDSSAVSVQNVSDAESVGWDHNSTRKLLWKMDRNIIPFMSLIYLQVFLKHKYTNKDTNTDMGADYVAKALLFGSDQHRKCPSRQSGGGPWSQRTRV